MRDVNEDGVIERESDQKYYSLRSVTSNFGDRDDVQRTGMCIFIPAGEIHSG